MNVYEMEGFLRGQCVPRDLLVNESNAAYLVRKLSEIASVKAERDAQQKRADALAVENAGFKRALSVILEHVDVTDKGPAGVVAMIANDELFNSETPATDAALAAIQAQGVEKFADELHKTAMAMCSVKPDNTTPGAYAGLARSFAKKLREAK
ncbi:hypothetical protein [Serratia bockelmannii]|uniref:hypothetical protein n=1 Tax=Serratia bockelmannii TaxID=2703793 RepID=UPI003FA719B2